MNTADRQVQVRTPLDLEVLDRRMTGQLPLHVEIRGTGQHPAHRAAVHDAEEEMRTSQQGSAPRLMKQKQQKRCPGNISPNNLTLALMTKMNRDTIPQQHLLADRSFRSPTQTPMKIRRKNLTKRRSITVTTTRTSQTEGLAERPVARGYRNGLQSSLNS